MQKIFLPLSPVGHRCVADEQCSPLQLSVLLYSCTRRGGHWPSVCENPQRCETERECCKDFCIITGRASVRSGRAMLAPTIIGAPIFCTRRGGHWPSACENLPRRPRRNFTIESILTLGYNVPYTGIISFALPCASKTAKNACRDRAPAHSTHNQLCSGTAEKEETT